MNTAGIVLAFLVGVAWIAAYKAYSSYKRVGDEDLRNVSIAFSSLD